jgi:hypothetical protein
VAAHQVVTDSKADHEARLAIGLTGACAVAFAAFVLPAYLVTDLARPSGLDVVWMLGTVFSVLLGPLVAGLAGYTSFVALWLHADTLPTKARRLHLVTLVVSMTVLGLLLTMGADVLSGWAD